jgi:tyrosyl-tRNA synthetase
MITMTSRRKKMGLEEQIALICKDAVEVVTMDEIRTLLETKEKPKCYWGVAPTGPPHLGYYRGIAKMQDLIEAGFDLTILIADVHAYLDNVKTPWKERASRAEVYKK